MKEKIRFKKIAKMTVTENVILAIFLIMSAILG
jgi:hypothetical protein